MKKRIILIIAIIILTFGVTWIIEPLSFNPFSRIEMPKDKSETDFSYKEPHLAVNSEGN